VKITHQEQKLAPGKSAALSDVPTLRKRVRQNIEEGATRRLHVASSSTPSAPA
jgi:hypothetical protein